MPKYKCHRCDFIFTYYGPHPCCDRCRTFGAEWLEDSPYAEEVKQ